MGVDEGVRRLSIAINISVSTGIVRRLRVRLKDVGGGSVSGIRRSGVGSNAGTTAAKC
jgi:hypothetical protein